MTVFERGSHILVVDDDAAVRALVALALDDEGYRVATAADGSDALALLRRCRVQRPDLILLDWRMRTPAWVFAKEYRSLPGPKAPIVVLTGAQDAVEAALEIDAQGFLCKPFDLDELLQVVRSLTRPSAPGAPDAPSSGLSATAT